jgi:hypothetical protein
MAQLLTSTDATVRFISSRMIEKERSTSGRAFLPALEVVNILQSSPGLSRQQLKHQSTDKVVHSDNYERLHLQSPQVPGECFRLEVDTFDIWSLALSSLPDILFKFSLNPMVDCLPHNQNLLKWGKVQSQTGCPLCGQLQSPQHILNSCPTALEQQRYNQQHDLID